MSTDQSAITTQQSKDFLFLHVRELPYFRGLLRAIESCFYQGLELPSPVYDLGCGDGLFAALTFDRQLDVGLDPWHGPIHEAPLHGAYRSLVEADAARAPFPSAYFGSAISNSVLEHIPAIDDVLRETARLLKPGAPFVFCVPNHNFLPYLSVARFLDRLGLKPLADAYRRFFNRISRHHHCDDPETWRARLEAAGFRLEKYWHYFSPASLAVLEWGHAFGLPSWVSRMLFGRWILSPTRWNLAPTLSALRPYYNEPVPQEHGVYTFYIARRR